MSRKEKIAKVNSPKINSEYLTTISSSNFPINQTMLSSNSKENKKQSNISRLKCTCNHPMQKTFQKQQLKCTCKVYKNNTINNMNSYKTESRQSRFDQMTAPIKYNQINNYMGMSGQKSFRSQSYRMDTFYSESNNSKLVCTCKHKRNNNFYTNRTYSEIKRHIYLMGQKTENLQILAAPAPLLTTQYVQNLAIIQNSKPITTMISQIKNEISDINKEETKKIIPEKKVEEEKVEEKQEIEKVEEIEKEEKSEENQEVVKIEENQDVENVEENQGVEKSEEKQEEEKVEEKQEEEKVEEKQEEEKVDKIEKEEKVEEIEKEEKVEEKEEENEQEINEGENEQEENEQEENEQEEKEQEEKEEEDKEEIEKEEINEDNKKEENEEITEEKPEIIQEEIKEEEIPEEKEEEEKPDEKIEDIPEEIEEEKPEEKIEEKPEVKEEEKIVINDDYNRVGKTSYIRRIRANIIKVQPQEESEKDSSSASDYDVLQKITTYKGEFKYKNLVNQSLDLIQCNSAKAKQKINIKTPSYTSDNLEKLANTNVIRFTTIKTYEPDSKDMQSNGQEIYEVPLTPDGLDNSPDIIQDHDQAPEDSPYPGELVSNKNIEKENIDNDNQEPNNNNRIKNQKKINNMAIINNQDSPMEKQYIDMKIEEAVSNKNQIINKEEKSQEHDDNNEPKEEIKVNIGENNNNENIEQNNEKESGNGQDVETYEIEENMDKNENNGGDEYFYNELEIEGEDKEKSDDKNGTIKQHLTESQESLEQKDQLPNENEIDDNDNDNIEEELGRYVEEQQNKKIQEKLDNERKKKIKVYDFIKNKNLQIDENQEPNSVIVFIKSSVKINRENNIIDDNSKENGYSSSEGLDIEPKNTVVK